MAACCLCDRGAETNRLLTRHDHAAATIARAALLQPGLFWLSVVSDRMSRRTASAMLSSFFYLGLLFEPGTTLDLARKRSKAKSCVDLTRHRSLRRRVAAAGKGCAQKCHMLGTLAFGNGAASATFLLVPSTACAFWFCSDRQNDLNPPSRLRSGTWIRGLFRLGAR